VIIVQVAIDGYMYPVFRDNGVLVNLCSL